MNLISETHCSCERREYAFMVLREYTIISQEEKNVNKTRTSMLFIYLFFLMCNAYSFFSVWKVIFMKIWKRKRVSNILADFFFFNESESGKEGV